MSLKLSDVADEIQNGDVFLFRGNRLFSRVIKWKTQSVYSHVGVALRIKVDGHTQLTIMEALEGTGVRLFPIDTYLLQCQRQDVPVEWFQITNPDINRDKIAAYVLRRWGARYASWWQFIINWSLWFYFMRRFFGYQPKNLNPNRFFCSELVTAAFQAGGYVHDEYDGKAFETDPGSVSRFTCLQRRGVLTLATDSPHP